MIVVSVASWVAKAKERVTEVLDDQHAVVLPELESRIAEAGWHGSGLNIDPHHITTAVRVLTNEGTVHLAEGATRGGRPIKTLQTHRPLAPSHRDRSSRSTQTTQPCDLFELGTRQPALPPRPHRPSR